MIYHYLLGKGAMIKFVQEMGYSCILLCRFVILKDLTEISFVLRKSQMNQASLANFYRQDVLVLSPDCCVSYFQLVFIYITIIYPRPPLSSTGQTSWLRIQRSGFDSRRYQIF
jgi:hypothetical protein